MKKLLLVLMVLLSVAAMSQPQLTWRFANAQLVNGDTQMQFDVQVISDIPGNYIYIGQLGFQYNTVAFGTNINGSGNVLIERGALLQELAYGVPGLYKYNIISTGDPFSNTLGSTFQTAFAAGFAGSVTHTAWPTAWTTVWVVTINIDAGAPAGTLAGLHFWETGMDGQESCQIGPIPPATNLLLCMNPNFYDNDLDLFEVVPGGGPIPTDWIGTFSEVWNEPLNWTNGIPLPDETQVVTIDATGKAAPVIYGSAVAGTLNLIAGQLTIAPGGDLTTLGLFTNNGLLYMSNLGGVSGSYIDVMGVVGSGSFQYDRDVFCSGQAWNSNDPFGWHYIGSPVDGFSTDNLYDYFVNAWNEGATGVDPDFPWMHYGYDPYTTPCTTWPTTFMGQLEGWSINFDPAYPYTATCGTTLPTGTGNIVEFMGNMTQLHSMTTYPIGFSAPATAAGGHAYAGWNFYGNPYAASLDPSLFNWPGFENGTWGVAMWSEDCTAGNYIYSSLGNGYANYVGPTQGFFMLTTGATTFALTGAERVPTSAPSIYKDAVSNLLTLEAKGDGTSDVTYIRFMDDMEAGKDVADFPKLFSTAEGLAQIYTTALGEQLAINALPETPVVPMGFSSVTSGEYTISAVETSEFTNVVLEDRFTGEQTDLLTSSYTFTYTVNDDPDRFFVHFTPLGAPELSAASIQIWSNDHKIYVQAPEINGDIVVFNMMGQEVIRTEIEPGLNILPVSDVNTYYVVKVVSSDVARTGKVYVK